MRAKFAALRVDDLELLFDAESKARHEGDNTSVVSLQSAVVSHESSVSVGGRQCQSSVGGRQSPVNSRQTGTAHGISHAITWGNVAETLEGLLVWQRARAFATAVFAILERPAFDRERRLRDQIKDATDSVVSNIAEGFEQSTDRGFVRYLYISKGSTREVRTRLVLALERNLISAEQQRNADELGDEVARLTTGLIKYLAKSNRQNRGQGLTPPHE